MPTIRSAACARTQIAYSSSCCVRGDYFRIHYVTYCHWFFRLFIPLGAEGESVMGAAGAEPNRRSGAFPNEFPVFVGHVDSKSFAQ